MFIEPLIFLAKRISGSKKFALKASLIALPPLAVLYFVLGRLGFNLAKNELIRLFFWFLICVFLSFLVNWQISRDVKKAAKKGLFNKQKQ